MASFWEKPLGDFTPKDSGISTAGVRDFSAQVWYDLSGGAIDIRKKSPTQPVTEPGPNDPRVIQAKVDEKRRQQRRKGTATALFDNTRSTLGTPTSTGSLI